MHKRRFWSVENNLLWFLLHCLGSVLLLQYMFGIIFRFPGDILLTTGGDGGKNYFTYLYHVAYGKGLHFTGMNYPFGEHIVFTDNIPLLSWTLVKLNHWIPISADTALGIMHLAIPVSCFITGILLFFILRREGINNVLSCILSLLITGLCPQLFRVFGHFSLSYTCFVPLLILLLQRWKQDGWNVKGCIALFITVTFFSLLHVYYLVQALVTVGSFAFIQWVLNGAVPLRQKIKWLVPPVSTVLGAFVVFKLLLSQTDAITDRTNYPWGMLSANATPHSVLTSRFTVLGNVLRFVFNKPEGSDFTEGYGYIGFIGLMVVFALVFASILWIGGWFKKSLKTQQFVDRSTLVYLLWGCCALALAFGIPFVWGGESMIDHISVFRQFRAMGRFVYIFYFLFSIAACKLLYQFLVMLWGRQLRTMTIGIATIGLFLWSTEVFCYAEVFRDRMAPGQQYYRDFFNREAGSLGAYLRDHKIDSNQYQCIIVLPYFHNGSEKIWIENSHTAIGFAFRTAYLSGLPMTNVMMSRTSWSQTFENVRLIGGPYTDKSILKRFNAKKILLINLGENNKDPDTQSLVQSGQFQGSIEGFDFYDLDPATLLQHDKELIAGAKAKLEAAGAGTGNVGEDWFTEHFDGHKSSNVLAGSGALKFTGDTLVLVDRAFTVKDTAQQYEISGWGLVQDKTFRAPYFTIFAMDSAGQVILQQDILFKESTDNKGLWFRKGNYLKFPQGVTHLRIIANQGGPGSCSVVDELQVRPVNKRIISKNSLGQLMINNHLVENQ